MRVDADEQENNRPSLRGLSVTWRWIRLCGDNHTLRDSLHRWEEMTNGQTGSGFSLNGCSPDQIEAVDLDECSAATFPA